MKTGMTQLWVQVILYLILILSGTWMLLCPISGMDFQAVEGGGIRYEPAVVTEVLEEELTPSTLGSQLLGRQTLEIRLEDGSTVTLENYLTDTHNVLAEAGQKVVVCVDAPEGAEPYYTLYNYDRSGAVAVIVLIFLGLMVLVGRRKGFDAALALLFSLLFLFRITLPSIYAGSSPIGAGMIAVLISTTVTMLLLYGVHIRSVLAIGVTLAGECAACLFFLLFSQMLHISGFQTSDAESLLVAAQQTGLEIEQLLFAATMIASLGGGHGRSGFPALGPVGDQAERDGPFRPAVAALRYEHRPGYDRHHEQHVDFCLCRRRAWRRARALFLRCTGGAAAQL